MAQFEELKEQGIFPLGEKNEAYAQFFTGQSYLKALAQAPDGHFGVGNVTFEPGCRNNWHRHLGGYQILLVTGGARALSRSWKISPALAPRRCGRHCRWCQTLAWGDSELLV